MAETKKEGYLKLKGYYNKEEDLFYCDLEISDVLKDILLNCCVKDSYTNYAHKNNLDRLTKRFLIKRLIMNMINGYYQENSALLLFTKDLLENKKTTFILAEGFAELYNLNDYYTGFIKKLFEVYEQNFKETEKTIKINFIIEDQDKKENE